MKPTLPLLLLLLLAGCYAPRGAWVWADDFTPPGGAGGYVIVPGDVLMVRVFQQEANSARVRVRPDGMVSLPLLSDQPAAGRTPSALAAELQAQLRAFLNNPVVTVSLEEPRALTVSVVGEVVRPGVHPLEPGAGLLQAVAAAGGLTEYAHRDGLFVLRTLPSQPEPARVRFTWERLSAGEEKSLHFQLLAGDVVVVE